MNTIEKFCLHCNTLGHYTNACHSTHGLNRPQDRELSRLCTLANLASLPPLRCEGCGKTIAEHDKFLHCPPDVPKLGLAWACERWRDEVQHRPLVNVHRRTLDDTWRQVVRYFGGDPVDLLGPSHDDLVAQQ